MLIIKVYYLQTITLYYYCIANMSLFFFFVKPSIVSKIFKMPRIQEYIFLKNF